MCAMMSPASLAMCTPTSTYTSFPVRATASHGARTVCRLHSTIWPTLPLSLSTMKA